VIAGAGCEGVPVRVVDGDLVQQEEPFDGFSAVLGGHAAVVAQKVSDLAVQPLQA